MFAVFVDGGRQYRVQPGDELRVDFRETAQPGDAIRFEEVLCAGNSTTSSVGRPAISSAAVEAEVLGEAKGPKLEIGKLRRRKNMKRHTGHRQKYTSIRIKSISAPGIDPDPVAAETAPAPAAG